MLVATSAMAPLHGLPKSPFRKGSRWLAVAIAAFVVLLMVAPGSSVVATAAASPSAAHPATVATVQPSSSAPPATGSAAIAGQSAVGEATIHPSQLLKETEGFPALAAERAASKTHALTQPSIATPTVPSASSPRSGVSGSSSLNYGWITGTVVSSVIPHDPVSGATVSAEPVTGFCPSVGCNPVQTTATGSFTVAASVGENVVLVSDGYYLTNRTWAYVTAGGYVSVGTIQLVEDGFVSGVLLGDDPAHEPVPGINVSSLSRDGAVSGAPSSHTDGAGDFTVAVPPYPSEITFTPIFPFAPYESNVTFVNVSSGQSISIGTVYLEKMTTVEVEIEDAESHTPISGLPAAIQVCSKATQYCPIQGMTSGGPYLTAQAPVGPDYMQVFVTGYVLNTTSLGVVPVSRPGSAPVYMGVVYVVPEGAFQMWANVSGIPPAKGQNDPTTDWPLGEFAIVSTCNEDGLALSGPTITNMTSSECGLSCVNPYSQSLIPAAPLRNYFEVEPDESGCLFPGYPTWPIPGDLPVFPTWDWVNVTPDKITEFGGADMLPGTYIEGQVLPSSQTGWTVTACSTDEPSECGPGVYSDQGYQDSYRFFVPDGCPQPAQPASYITETTFCVPAPPGPDELRVTPSNASENYTWAYDPPLSWSLIPLPLANADEDRSNEINITSATVSGRVLQARSLTPVIGLPAVQVCPAGALPSGAVCGNGVVNSTGFFTANAPPGWDKVTVSAPQYEPNATWVYVEVKNNTGTILLDPYGYVNGFVDNPQGVGVYEATVDICPVTSPTACTSVGSDGLTSTDGAYYGAAPAGPLPVGTYEVKASAPGYVTEWTWVNISTPGQNFTAPNIVLTPVASGSGGGNASRPMAGVRSASSSPTYPGSWVTGRVIDAKYNIGLPGAGIIAAPLSGATPILISSIRGSGGEFNDTLPDGTYSLNLDTQGYYPASVFLNVSGNASVVSLGTISLAPFPTVTGRLVIDPKNWSTGVTLGMGLGPGAPSLIFCTNQATICAPGGYVGTSGNFNASAPAGIYDLVEGAGTGTGPGTATGGFVNNQTYVNVTNDSLTNVVTSYFGLDIFAVLSGTIVNANATSQATLPVRYDQVTADTTYPVDYTQGEVVNAVGQFTIIFPESFQLNMTAGGLGAWVPVNYSDPANFTTPKENSTFVLAPGGSLVLPPIPLEHFGTVDAQIVDNRSGLGIPYATISATENGHLWGLPTTFSSSGDANGGGFVNLSVPPSIPAHQRLVKLFFGGPDYLSTNFSVEVNASATTYANGTSYAHLKPIRLLPWGWISGQVSDALSGRLLPNVAVSVSVKGVPYGNPGITTNGLGEYRIDAPPGPNVTVALNLQGYSSNRSVYNVTVGKDIQAALVHLTGDSVVAGRVVSDPGSVPVAGATVNVCPSSQPNCSTSVTTNDTGYFWLAAAPGLDVVEASLAGYVSNSSGFVKGLSDQWVWAGVISIQQYAYVAGTVIGLPSGVPLDGANASLCAPPIVGSGAGPCFTTVLTQPDGSFFLEAPAGSYVLDANATEYNDTYLSVSLTAGETLPVGLVFVQEYGTATGAVYGADTDQAAPGATVVACEAWGLRVCSAPVPTEAGGIYVITGRPGPYQLEASAPGYQTAFESIVLASGSTVTAPTFLLIPIGPNTMYTVSGTVRAESNPGLSVAGALVTATGGYSAPANAFGEYTLSVPWGDYTISAVAPGYVISSRTLEVNASVSGINFLLAIETYPVTGVIRDGLTGEPIDNVTILEDGATLGATGSNGAYAIVLANGTHDLVAEAGSGYSAVSFVVVVAGAWVSDSLTMYPPEVTLDGLVVDSLTGLPLSSASVVISGTTADGTSWSANAVTAADGRFVVVAYPGKYTAVAQLTGYSSASMSVDVASSPSSLPLTLPLPPALTSAASTPTSAWVYATLGGLAAAAVAGVIVLAGRRARKPPSSERAGRPESTDQGGNLG